MVDDEARRGRFYWCRRCDVYGRGEACWGCDSADVVWDHVPKEPIPAGRVAERD